MGEMLSMNGATRLRPKIRARQSTPPVCASTHIDVEPCFKHLVDLASRQFETPLAVIFLSDEDGGWVKAARGLELGVSADFGTFLDYTSRAGDLLVVENAEKDARFSELSLVVSDPGIRFFAGTPLVSDDGLVIGMLCIADQTPGRDFSQKDRALLRDLATLTVDQLEAQTPPGSTVDDSRIHDRTREDLAIAEHRLQQLFEHSPVPTVMVDRDMRYIAMSRSWREAFDVGDVEIRGLSHYDVVPSVPEKWRQEHQACLSGAAIDIFKDQLIWADGKEIWVRRRLHPWHEPGGQIGGLIISNEVITDRIEAKSKLEHNQRFMEAVLSNVEDAILARDADGRLTLFNSTAKRLFGFDDGSPHPLTTDAWPQMYAPGDDDPLPRDQLPLVRATLGEHVRSEELVIKPPGEPARTIIVTATQMRDRDGSSIGAVATAHDATSEREAEAKRREAALWYRAIFDQSFQSCALLGPDGRVLELNASATALVHGTADSQIGLPMWDCSWWDTGGNARKIVRRAVEKAMRGEFVRSETQTRIKGGQITPIDFSLKPCFDEAGAVSFIIWGASGFFETSGCG